VHGPHLKVHIAKQPNIFRTLVTLTLQNDTWDVRKRAAQIILGLCRDEKDSEYVPCWHVVSLMSDYEEQLVGALMEGVVAQDTAKMISEILWYVGEYKKAEKRKDEEAIAKIVARFPKHRPF